MASGRRGLSHPRCRPVLTRKPRCSVVRATPAAQTTTAGAGPAVAGLRRSPRRRAFLRFGELDLRARRLHRGFPAVLVGGVADEQHAHPLHGVGAGLRERGDDHVRRLRRIGRTERQQRAVHAAARHVFLHLVDLALEGVVEVGRAGRRQGVREHACRAFLVPLDLIGDVGVPAGLVAGRRRLGDGGALRLGGRRFLLLAARQRRQRQHGQQEENERAMDLVHAESSGFDVRCAAIGPAARRPPPAARSRRHPHRGGRSRVPAMMK